jgi:signal peptidase I
MTFAVGLEKIAQQKDRMYCLGPSMRPTLMAGDLLSIFPYNGLAPRVGDVIVFQAPGEEKHITHRVISVTPQGIRTRGDNNNLVDPYLLKPENIIGRVTHAERGKRKKAVAGGYRGFLRAQVLYVLRVVRPHVRIALAYPYRLLYRSGVFQPILSRLVRVRVVSFQRPQGVELQLLWGRRIIGQLPAGAEQWVIKPPFKLVVREEELARWIRPSPIGAARPFS